MRTIFPLLLLVVQCASQQAVRPPLERYEERTCTYVNDLVGFRLSFDPSWLVYASEANMPAQGQALAQKIRAAGGRMISMAHNVSRTLYFRAVVEETDLTPEAYFAIIEKANQTQIRNSMRAETTAAGRPAIRWYYDTRLQTGSVLKFSEWQIKRGRYNMRFTFWTSEPLFYGAVPDFERIMATYAELAPAAAPPLKPAAFRPFSGSSASAQLFEFDRPYDRL